MSANIENNKRQLEADPIEAIFELNMGDFLTEYLISDDLLDKINTSTHDKTEGLKNQLKELISVYSIDNTLNLLGFNNTDDFVIYNSIAKTTVNMLDIDACHIFLTNENTNLIDIDNDLVLVGTSLENSSEIFKQNIGFKFDDIDNVVVKSFLMNDITTINKPEDFNDWKPIDILNEDKVKSAVIVPMSSNSGKVGIIVLESYKEKTLIKEFTDLVDVTATLFVTSMNLQKLVEETTNLLNDETTSAMELRHVRTELTALIGDLSDEQQVFVESLARSVDAKSHYEDHHSLKVAELTEKICDYLHLNEKSKELIYYAGMLQNIGKITLPEELFTKKQKLSKEDWDKLQNHPNVGVSLLMKINFLAEVVPYVHYHKERWDGRGEPEGLSGNSIPLGSRIIAVSDAFTALTSERPYRKAMNSDDALEVMKKEAGIKWDPIIVDALAEVIKI
ncbi:MAG: HD domain-containing protein [Candidatus Gastranaerophilales bacterium]|nr:HD domain-containing protein [Candidatus Gastranaerophilales bacterium]